MKQNVLVIGHADADGHLIAEQVRRNLASVSSFHVSVVVDPLRTKDHKAWMHLDAISEIEDADLVFFVDMMFAPAAFVEEAEALVEFVRQRDNKRFFLIDHHPLPLRRLEQADNLRVLYRPQVFDCAFGPRSGMMVVAALCEGQKANVSEIKEPVHETLALAMRRAAAIGGTLNGEKLLALLREDCWEGLSALGQEAKELHYLPRGRRPVGQAPSKMLRSLERTATEIIAGSARRQKGTERRDAMAYDMDVAVVNYAFEDGHRKRATNFTIQPRDLETVLTILEIAALSLTNTPGATFARKDLIKEAHEIAGSDIDILDEDIDIVLQKQGFLKRVGRELCLR